MLLRVGANRLVFQPVMLPISPTVAAEAGQIQLNRPSYHLFQHAGVQRPIFSGNIARHRDADGEDFGSGHAAILCSAMANVIVTGASTGIGRAIALDLHRRGWSVLAGVRRKVDGADLLAAAKANESNANSATTAGGRLQPLHLDITNADDLAASTKIAAEFCGDAGLQVLINNAGIVVPGPLEFLPLDGFRKQLDVNTTGALAATQQFLPLLRLAAASKPSHKPRILMVSSISGRVGTPMVGAYNASKFALEGMSDALRRELLSHGIDVVLIEPGAIATPIWRTTSIRAQRMEPEFPQQSNEIYAPFVQSLRNNLPKIEKRAIPAERVAEVVYTAVSKRRPKARYLIGTDAKMGAWLQRLLPTRWFDRLIVWDALRNN